MFSCFDRGSHIGFKNGFTLSKLVVEFYFYFKFYASWNINKSVVFLLRNQRKNLETMKDFEKSV